MNLSRPTPRPIPIPLDYGTDDDPIRQSMELARDLRTVTGRVYSWGVVTRLRARGWHKW